MSAPDSIQSKWEDFESILPPIELRADQREMLRFCFYGGAAAMLGLQMVYPPSLSRAKAWCDEAEAFILDFMQRHP